MLYQKIKALRRHWSAQLKTSIAQKAYSLNQMPVTTEKLEHKSNQLKYQPFFNLKTSISSTVAYEILLI